MDFDTFLSEDFRALLPELEHWMESVAGSSSISLTFLVFHNSIASLLLAAQHRKLDLSWVKRQLLSMCTAEALCRYHRKHRPDAEWKASAHRSLPAFLAAHSHGYELDWIIYTFSSEISLEPLVPETWKACFLKLANLTSADDAQSQIKDFFNNNATALFVQCVLKEDQDDVHRMIEHLMRMVADSRCQDPSKWVIFVVHIVKNNRPTRLPLHLSSLSIRLKQQSFAEAKALSWFWLSPGFVR